MECHNCKTSRLIASVRERFGEKIPTELRAILHDTCLVCSHACRTCRTLVPDGPEPAPQDPKAQQKGRKPSKPPKKRPPVSAYARKRAIERKLLALSRITTEPAKDLPPPPKPSADDIFFGRAEALSRDRAPTLAPRIVSSDPAAVAALKAELAQIITAHCSRCDQSQDDNPSHRGITFVSKDADNGSDDPNVQLEDWLLAQKETDALEVYRSGCTALPADIENAFRVQLTEFAQLSVYDKLLVCVLMSQKPGYTNRYYTLADFARLRWLNNPETAKIFAQCGINLTLTGDGISKQAAHVRYGNIVRKIPALAAIAHGQIGKGKGGGAKPVRETDLEEDQTDFMGVLFTVPPPAATTPQADPDDTPAPPAAQDHDDTPDRPTAVFAPNISTAVRSRADSVDPDPDFD